MNPVYVILCDGSRINFSEVFKMAHRRTKWAIQDGDKNSYKSIFRDCLYYAMIWARSIAEVNGRT